MNPLIRPSTSETQQLSQLLRQSIDSQTLLKVVLSKPRNKKQETGTRIDIRPVEIRGQRCYQFASRINNQETHENFNAEQSAVRLFELVGADFLDCFLRTQTEEVTARFKRSGSCRMERTTAATKAAAQPKSHDRQRQYLIPDDQPVGFLIETGIMSAEGRVRAKHYHKFRQINRYVEFIADVIGQFPESGPIRVVDFGCGKIYLTFATHYLLTEVHSREVEIVGLDRRPDVVETCRRITDQLELKGLSFEQGDIASWKPNGPIHMAVSLHACDTATDDALAVAASWKSAVIFAAPCCQHELAHKLPRDRFPGISQHGILHERFAALATDARRAGLMEAIGYRTQVMEFIDLEHTPKNLLIRCIRRRESSSESSQKGMSAPKPVFSDASQLPQLQLERKLKEFGLLPEAT